MSGTPVLELDAVSAGYAQADVLRGLSWKVEPGQLWAVVGPNGAGKSTLLKVAMGWLTARAGAARLFGKSAQGWAPPELARRVAWVPQHVDAEAGFTALELVLMGRSPHLGWWGLPSAKDVALAQGVMEELGVAHLAARRTHQLSGGEQRLLWLARALTQGPDLLLLDEPTAFLDLKHQVDALRRVKARVKAGLTAVAVLHDVNLAAAFADQVLLLKDGGALAQGAPHDTLTQASVEALFGVAVSHVRAEGGQHLFAPRMAS